MDENQKLQGDKGMNMTTGSIPKLLIKFAIPSIGQSIIQVINSLVVAILAGRFIGAAALGAVAISMPIVFIINSVAMGATQANSILLAQAYGRKDFHECRRIIDTSFITLMVICIIMVTIGISCCNILLALIKTPKEIFGLARVYFVLHLIGVPFLFTQFLFFSSFRGIGNASRPMWLSFLSVGLNIIMLPLFVTGIFGLPKIGIAGLGISDIIANVTIFIVIFVLLKRENSIIIPHIIKPMYVPNIAKMLMKIGMPSMLQQVLLNASVLFLISLINSHGATVTEGYGVATRIDGIIYAMSFGICASVSIIAGQNLGVERYDRVSETCKWGVIYAVLISVIPAFFAFFFPELLMKCFTDDLGVIKVGAQYLKISAINCILVDILMVFEGIPMAAGQTWIATVVTVIATCLCRLPVAYWLNNKIGILGIWLAHPVSIIVAIIVIIVYYFSGKWKVKNLISQVKEEEPLSE